MNILNLIPLAAVMLLVLPVYSALTLVLGFVGIDLNAITAPVWALFFK